MPHPDLKTISKIVMALAAKKKFGVRPEEVNTGEKIALIHSEVSEAMAAFREKRLRGRDGFAEELADAVIRIIHLSGIHKIDLEKEILKKLAGSQTRNWDWSKLNETHS